MLLGEMDAELVGLTFVNHIPVVALPLVAPHDRVDVVRHDLDQRRVVEVAVGYPVGQLRVPDEGVAAQVLLVLRRPVDVLVGGAKVELAAVRLGLVPFLGVLGRDGAEFALDDVLLLLVVANGQRGADVFAAGGHHGGVEGLDLSVEEPESMGLVLGSVWLLKRYSGVLTRRPRCRRAEGRRRRSRSGPGQWKQRTACCRTIPHR